MSDQRCPDCNGSTFSHVHDAAHGIPGTHMDGSERFTCYECGRSVFARDNVPGFRFVLDGTSPKEQP